MLIFKVNYSLDYFEK